MFQLQLALPPTEFYGYYSPIPVSCLSNNGASCWFTAHSHSQCQQRCSYLFLFLPLIQKSLPSCSVAGGMIRQEFRYLGGVMANCVSYTQAALVFYFLPGSAAVDTALPFQIPSISSMGCGSQILVLVGWPFVGCHHTLCWI